MAEQARIFSFGGGWQSTACLVLAAQGRIDFHTFCFANTGDDSENPETLLYIEQHAKPFAAKHGLEIVTVAKNGQTLYQNCMGDNRTIAIPVRMSGTGAPGNRKCTSDWKIKPVARFARERGATKKNPAVVGIGISKDEWHRAKDSLIKTQVHEFPLLTLKLDWRPRPGVYRDDCATIIMDAGLPLPPKSSCWFCPYKKIREWREMATKDPERFEMAAKLEAKLEAKRGTFGKDSVYLTDRLKPLQEAIVAVDQLSLFGDEECSGYCWT